MPLHCTYCSHCIYNSCILPPCHSSLTSCFPWPCHPQGFLQAPAVPKQAPASKHRAATLHRVPCVLATALRAPRKTIPSQTSFLGPTSCMSFAPDDAQACTHLRSLNFLADWARWGADDTGFLTQQHTAFKSPETH